MLKYLLLAAPALGMSLSTVSTVVCGCPRCLVTDVVTDTPYSIINYGNSSANVFDWLGAARDFLLAPTTLNSSNPIDCAMATAFILNGSTLVSQLAWTQLDANTCFVNLTSTGDGDFALVSAVHSPNASIIVTQPMPNAPIQPISIGLNTATLNVPFGASCSLPSSFEFCGTNFTASSCSAEETVYAGTCATPPAESAIPDGCYGNPLFQFIALAQAWSAGSQVLIASVSAGVTSGVFALVAAIQSPTVMTAASSLVASGHLGEVRMPFRRFRM